MRVRLFHPVPLLATAVLLLNDHWLKYAYPSWITGKLSDFAGLFLFPIVCVGIVGRGRTLACIVTGVAFAAVKLHPPAFLSIVRDPTDLIALPMLIASWHWMGRRAARGCGEVAAIAVSALACVATSPPRYVRNYPRWETNAGEAHVGCADIRIWIAKTGKEGMGATVAVRGCDVRIDRARFEIAGRAIDAPVPVAGSGELYLPFAFDGNQLWNEGQRNGTLLLAIAAGDERAELRIPLTMRLDGYFRDRRQP